MVVKVNLGQVIFHCITALSKGRRKNQKLPLPSLIYQILNDQKPLKENTKYLIALMS